MAIGGEGPLAVALMWTLTVTTFIFVVLRIYTRIKIVKSFGVDDHVYNLAFAFLAFYTIFMTVAAHYGVGQNMADITPEDVPRAILFQIIGQTFGILGMATAKSSLGLFLLRLVEERWHKIAIWTFMLCLNSVSIATCFTLWLQCSPSKYLWDRRISGRCHMNTFTIAMLLCILGVIVDFAYAAFPWLFIWGLQMNRKEKIIIILSLGLGVIAGVCGIMRTIGIPKHPSPNYTKDTVAVSLWSAGEIAITMICIGIPVCRPLYTRYLKKLTSRDGSQYYEQSGGGRYRMRSIHRSAGHRGESGNDTTANGADFNDNVGRKLGFSGPLTRSKVYATNIERVGSDNQSEEAILGPDHRSSQHDNIEAQENGTRVTYEVTTSR